MSWSADQEAVDDVDELAGRFFVRGVAAVDVLETGVGDLAHDARCGVRTEERIGSSPNNERGGLDAGETCDGRSRVNHAGEESVSALACGRGVEGIVVAVDA
jgi:hypothetical protein